MKRIIIILTLAVLTGCANMTHEEKRNAWIVVGAVVVTGAIIASQDGSNDSSKNKCYAIVPPGSIEPRLC